MNSGDTRELKQALNEIKQELANINFNFEAFVKLYAQTHGVKTNP